MADVDCTCGHPHGRHVEILSHHSAIHGERWCRDCDCKRFEPAAAARDAPPPEKPRTRDAGPAPYRESDPEQGGRDG